MRYVAMFALSVFGVCGCNGTMLTTSGAITKGAPVPGAVRYSLARTVVVADATISRKPEGKVKFCKTAAQDTKPEASPKEQPKPGESFKVTVDTDRKVEGAKVKLTLVSKAIPDEWFYVKIDPGSVSDDSLTVETGPDGVLKSIGVTTTGQAGEIVKNVGIAVASVAAIVGLVALSDCDDQVKQSKLLVDHLCQSLTNEKHLVASCDAVLGKLSAPALYYLYKTPANRGRWFAGWEAGQRRNALNASLTSLETGIAKASGKDLADIKARAALLTAALERAQKDAEAAGAKLDDSMKKFLDEEGIASEASTETRRLELELADLPTSDDFPGDKWQKLCPDGVSCGYGVKTADATTLLAKFEKMRSFFHETGCVLTITPQPIVASTTQAAGPPSDAPSVIYYRQAYPAMVASYCRSRVKVSTEEVEALVYSDSIIDGVVNRASPLIGLPFVPNDWAERKLALTFDDKGRLAKVEQGGKSAAAAGAKAAADTIQGARDAYATTLSKVAEIQENQRKIADNQILTQIDRLTQQKKLLDARMDLDSTSNNYGLVLEQRELDAKLATLQSQRALQTEIDTGKQAEELAKLKAQVDLLNAQVELLKARTGAMSDR